VFFKGITSHVIIVYSVCLQSQLPTAAPLRGVTTQHI